MLSLLMLSLLHACAVAEAIDAEGAPDPGFPDAGMPRDTLDSGQGVNEIDAGQPTTPMTRSLTDSSLETIVKDNSVGCLDVNTDSHLENSYMRVLDLSSHGVVGSFAVNRVEIGIEIANSGTGTTQPATVRLHTLSGPMSMANLTEIGRTDLALPNQQLAVQSVDIQGVAPAGSKLVVEFFTPNGLSAGHELLAGSNSGGQQSPTYIRSLDCSINEPIAAADPSIGQPQMHWVVTVVGTDSN